MANDQGGTMSRSDRIVVALAVGLVAGLGLLTFALQMAHGESLFLKRVVAGLAGCF